MRAPAPVADRRQASRAVLTIEHDGQVVGPVLDSFERQRLLLFPPTDAGFSAFSGFAVLDTRPGRIADVAAGTQVVVALAVDRDGDRHSVVEVTAHLLDGRETPALLRGRGAVVHLSGPATVAPGLADE